MTRAELLELIAAAEEVDKAHPLDSFAEEYWQKKIRRKQYIELARLALAAMDAGELPPMQPIVMAEDGVVRFKRNRIVRHLLDNGPFDMNRIALLAAEGEFTDEEQAQFAQLIGYSVSGWGSLSYVSEAECERADELAAVLEKKS